MDLQTLGLHGLGFKAQSMNRKSQSLFFPFIRKLTIKSSTWVGQLNTILVQEFELTNLQKLVGRC